MVGIRSIRCALLASFAALAGCAGGLNNGAPPVVRIENDVIDNPPNAAFTAIRTAFQTHCLSTAALPEGEDPPEARRDRLVTAYMLAVDIGYNQYERNLLDAIRQNDLGASSASLALSTIGSVVGDQTIARALSTTNALVTGTHSAIGRDYLLNQTLTTLQTQMRANRATQRAAIVRRMRLGYSEWNSCMALSDVLIYEQTGTLNGALAAIAADAAAANREGERILAAAVEACVAEADSVSLGRRIRQYAERLGATNPAATRAARTANLRKVGEAMALPEAVRQGTPAALLQAIKVQLSRGTNGRCAAADYEALISRIQQATGETIP